MFSGRERERAASSISQEIFHIVLDGIQANERVIIERFTPVDITYTSFIIQRFNPVTGDWHTQYTWSVEGLVDTEIENQNWSIINAPVVILKITGGTGSFLSYRVVGYHFGVLSNLISRDTIFQGDVFFDNSNIIEQTGNQYRIWLVSDGRLSLFPYRIPIIPNAYVFEYLITDNGQVLVKRTEITLPAGGILQFIRRDFNTVSEKMLFSADEPDGVRIFQNRSAYRFLKPMNATFTIIPEGYNQEQAVNISVKVI